MTSKPGRRLCSCVVALTATWMILSSAVTPRLLLADGGLEKTGSVDIEPDRTRRPAVKVGGWLREVSPERLVVGQQLLEVGLSSVVGQDVEEGAYVAATAAVGEDGTLHAESVTALPTAKLEGASLSPVLPLAAPSSYGGTTGYAFEFRGVLEETNPRYWVVGSRLVFISDRTLIQGRPEIGALAEVKGQLLYSGIVLAKTIKLTTPDAFVEVEFEGIIEQWSQDVWTVSGVDVRISAVTEIAGAPGLGMAAEVQGILQPDDSVLAQRINVKTPGFAAQIEIEGIAVEITATHWVVAGQTLLVDNSTFVDESQAPAEVGMWAQVSALLRRDGSMLALRIRLARYR